MNRIAIIGSGDMGQQIAHMGLANGYSIVGYFDDYHSIGNIISGLPILGSIEDILTKKDKFDCIVIGIGYKHFNVRKQLYEWLVTENIHMQTIIDKRAIVDGTAEVGDGSIVMSNVILDKGVRIGANVFVNIGSVVAHDSFIGNHSFVAPRAAIAGFKRIGECNFLGINSTVIDNITTTDNVFIGGGGVVTKSLEEEGLYVGVPVRRIR